MTDPLWPKMQKIFEALAESMPVASGPYNYLFGKYFADPAYFYAMMLGPWPSMLAMMYPRNRHALDDFHIAVVKCINEEIAKIPIHTHELRDGVLVKLTDAPQA